MNPASLLHSRLCQYRAKTGSLSIQSRWHIAGSGGPVISDEDRAALVEAAVWLRDIARLLDGLERLGRKVGPYRRSYPIWVNSVLAVGKQWQANVGYQPEDVCPQTALDSLESLSDMLDLLTPAPEEPAHERLVALADEIAEGLEEDQTLSDQLRVHLQRVVNHLRECLTKPEAYNLADLAEAVDDAITAAKAAAGESTDSKWKERWRALSTNIVYPAVSGLIAGTGSTFLVQAAEQAQHLLGGS